MNNFDVLTNRFYPDFSWKITGIKDLLSRKSFKIRSKAFALNGYPVEAEAALELKAEDEVHMSLHLLDTSDSELADLKLLPTAYLMLKDRSGKERTENIVRSRTYPLGSELGDRECFEECLMDKEWLLDPLYNIDDSVIIEIGVEPPLMAQQVHSYDGSLSWTVSDFRWRKGAEEGGQLKCAESPFFYTGPSGYRVRVRLWLTGIGPLEDKGLSATVCFVTGPFDHDLPLTFPHLTTITLVNRKYPQRSVTKTVKENIEENADYDVDLCEYNEVLGLIENDTLFCKVVITPIQ